MISGDYLVHFMESIKFSAENIFATCGMKINNSDLKLK